MSHSTPPVIPGILQCTPAVTGALGLAMVDAAALALDGDQVVTIRLLDAGMRSISAYESLIHVLGYRLELVIASQNPTLTGIDHDAAGFHLLAKSLPREVPLTPPDKQLIEKQFVSLAIIRSHNYANPETLSLARLSERIASLVLAPPTKFPVKTVRYANDVVPLLIAAHHLAVYHTPLLNGYSSKIMTRLAEGGPDTTIDRHLTLYAHLGLALRLTGPAGVLTIEPEIHGVARCVKAANRFRAEANQRLANAEPTTPAKPRRRKRNATRIDASVIEQRLRAGESALSISQDLGITRQRIYFVANAAGLGKRQMTKKVSSRNLLQLPTSDDT